MSAKKSTKASKPQSAPATKKPAAINGEPKEPSGGADRPTRHC
jgi:hypothetical protein